MASKSRDSNATSFVGEIEFTTKSKSYAYKYLLSTFLMLATVTEWQNGKKSLKIIDVENNVVEKPSSLPANTTAVPKPCTE